MTALSTLLILADVELDGGAGTWQSLGGSAREISTVLGAVAVVVVAVVVWAVRFRRRRTHAHRHHHSHHAHSEPAPSRECSANGSDPDNSHKRRRWRRRRRDHRPRNPTLAETGGLPPARPEPPPEPFP